MFEVPVDGWYAWLGTAAASGAILAVVLAFPTAPPPDAVGVADTVDRTATTEYGASAEHPMDAATAVRITPRGIGLRNDAGRTHATFAYGPVTPVDDGPLRRVLEGAPPSAAFDSAATLRRAATAARSRDARWRPVDGPLLVRHVALEGQDVTLVGA